MKRSLLLRSRRERGDARAFAGSPIGVALYAGLCALTTVLVAGCNTVEGAGKDIQAAGEAIEDAADD